jgi:hypothetical protein
MMHHFIDAGFDIINPVQLSADSMDYRLLKQKYSERLTFWGVGIDTQKVLALGFTSDVEKQIKGQCYIVDP